MTIRDLLELASLDALGLLDDDERTDFEAAFRAASPEVQAQVRREQRRAADLDGILPNVEVPVGLRARVMGAVRRAIAEVSTPVATLPVADHRRAGFVFTRSTPVWRAACIGFATATIVLGGAFGWMARENRSLETLITSNYTLEELQKTLGPRGLEILHARNSRMVPLIQAASDVGQGVKGNIIIDADTGNAVLCCDGLPAISGSYRLIVRNGNKEKSLKDFQSAGGPVTLVFEGLTTQDLGAVEITGPDAQGGPDRTILRTTGA